MICPHQDPLGGSHLYLPHFFHNEEIKSESHCDLKSESDYSSSRSNRWLASLSALSLLHDEESKSESHCNLESESGLSVSLSFSQSHYNLI